MKKQTDRETETHREKNTHRKRERENYNLSRYLTKPIEAFKVCPDSRTDRQRDRDTQRETHTERERGRIIIYQGT